MHRTVNNFFWLWVFGAALFLAGCGESSDGGGLSVRPSPERITFANVGAHGIFDPAIARDPISGRLWMSYSAVDPSVTWPAQNVNVVSIRLAYSDDDGHAWTPSGSGAIISDFSDVTLPLAPPNDAGTWVSEVSQLIYDPGAVAAERWKILWHHYLIVNNVRQFQHGWIAMKMASTPDGLAAAPEIKLFAGYLYDSANDTLAGSTRSPVDGAPQVRLDTALNTALNTCVFSEPGMYATNSALYVSLLCVRLSDSNHLISLFKCTGACSAGSAWSYLGTALQNSDAAALGYDTGFSASGMFESGGNVYLVATPVQTAGAPWADYYSGCRVFKFANIDSALLQMSGSQPLPFGSVNGTPGSFNGACAYHAAANRSGVLYSELNASDTEMFQMYMSHTNF